MLQKGLEVAKAKPLPEMLQKGQEAAKAKPPPGFPQKKGWEAAKAKSPPSIDLIEGREDITLNPPPFHLTKFAMLPCLEKRGNEGVSNTQVVGYIRQTYAAVAQSPPRSPPRGELRTASDRRQPSRQTPRAAMPEASSGETRRDEARMVEVNMRKVSPKFVIAPHSNVTLVGQNPAPKVFRETPKDDSEVQPFRAPSPTILEFVEMEPYPFEEPIEVSRGQWQHEGEMHSPVRSVSPPESEYSKGDPPPSSINEVTATTSRIRQVCLLPSLQEEKIAQARALIAAHDARLPESSAQGAQKQPQVDTVELIRLFTEALRGAQESKPKVAKMREPAKFTGDNPKEDVNSWLRAMDNYLRDTPEDRWLDVARTFLAGRAEHMFVYRETILLSEGGSVDFTWFCEFMRTNFAPMLAKERAFRKLLDLRVKPDSSDYETVAQAYFEYRSRIPGGEEGFNFVMNQLFLRTITDRLRDKVLVNQQNHGAHVDIQTMHKICLLHVVKPVSEAVKPQRRDSPERKRFKTEVRVERKPSERSAGEKKSSMGGVAKTTCHKCGKKGHYARNCWGPRKDDKPTQGKDRPSR